MGLFTWWYGAGWLSRIRQVKDRLAGLYDYFSIDLLLRTLFSPFRQISAGGVRGPIGVQIRAWFDQLISRVIGMIVRMIVIVIGSVTLALACIGSLMAVLLWPLVPLMPVVGVVCSMIGWMPWKM